MRHTILILAMASSLAGFATTATAKDSSPLRSMAPVNVPVVTRQDFMFDLEANGGGVTPIDAARLDGWFRGLDLGYGDNIYVEGDNGAARYDVVRVAGRYGMMVSDGGPVLPGAIAPGSVRIVVSRTRASVPNCPKWSGRSEPNFGQHQHSNFGCGVNANLAAMIANPEDLVHGREGSGVGDVLTSTKAVGMYRSTAPTGSKGLQDVNTGGK